MNRRSLTYRKHWNELIETHGALCFYCRVEIAVSIDHIIPYSWDGDNGIENLVPACIYCNSTAGDKMFEDAEHKRRYILSRRKRSMRAVCTDCLLPFTYREHSPSMFLCSICYDIDYGTEYSHRKSWHKWMVLLKQAGIEPEAHVKARNIAGVWKRDRNYMWQLLIDTYTEYWNVVDLLKS